MVAQKVETQTPVIIKGDLLRRINVSISFIKHVLLH